MCIMAGEGEGEGENLLRENQRRFLLNALSLCLVDFPLQLGKGE